MKQINHFTCERVNGLHTVAFLSIATLTGIGRIAQHGLAASGFGNNMVNRKGAARKGVRAETVLAIPPRPLNDSPSQFFADPFSGHIYLVPGRVASSTRQPNLSVLRQLYDRLEPFHGKLFQFIRQTQQLDRFLVVD